MILSAINNFIWQKTIQLAVKYSNLGFFLGLNNITIHIVLIIDLIAIKSILSPRIELPSGQNSVTFYRFLTLVTLSCLQAVCLFR